MGKVTFKDPVDTISGRICKARPTIYCLGRKGVRKGNQWTTMQSPRDLSERPYSADETKSQTRFKEVRLAVKATKVNPNKLGQAYEAYAMVRDNYKSFDSYLWRLEMQKWNAEWEQCQEQEPLP